MADWLRVQLGRQRLCNDHFYLQRPGLTETAEFVALLGRLLAVEKGGEVHLEDIVYFLSRKSVFGLGVHGGAIVIGCVWGIGIAGFIGGAVDSNKCWILNCSKRLALLHKNLHEFLQEAIVDFG